MTLVEKVNECRWLLKDGEDARTVARAAYKDANKYADILKANPVTWEPGMRLIVPRSPGFFTQKSNEGDLSLLRRLFPETDPVKYLETLYAWNGKNIAEGDFVYVPKKP